MLKIQTLRNIDGVCSAFYEKAETVLSSGRRLLNVSRVKLMKALDGFHGWGEGFPWIAEFLEKLFAPEQLPYYLGWISHFYKGAMTGKTTRGLGLFIAGPPSTGKTFLNNAIHRVIFGGAEQATRYLTGEEQFSGRLFSSPLWTVDDAVASSDHRSRTRFSQNVKALIANNTHSQRGMYREADTLPWAGRLSIHKGSDPPPLSATCEITGGADIVP